MDSKTLPKGCHPGKGCFNCPYEDCINPDGSQLSEEEKAMLECGSPRSKTLQRRQKYNRAYRQKHRQEIRERKRAYYQQHRQEIREYSQAYRQQHRQELLEYNRVYYQQHRQEILEAQRKRRQESMDE